MPFNPDITKQAQEIIFSRKLIQVIQAYILIIHEYNEKLFKNILVPFLEERIKKEKKQK